jgi:hypothetical protein
MTLQQKIITSLVTGTIVLAGSMTSAFASDSSNNSGDNSGSNNHSARHNSKENLHASLTGSEEVPGPGDQDGKGRSRIRIDADNGKICTKIHARHLSTPTAAHIHKGAKGVAGPVVVSLPTPNEDGYAKDCMSADNDLLSEIADHPSEYYVNVHTDEYPDGALRGQLYN